MDIVEGGPCAAKKPSCQQNRYLKHAVIPLVQLPVQFATKQETLRPMAINKSIYAKF